MSAIVNALIAGRHQRLLRGALWGGIFAALLAIGYGFIVWQVRSHLRGDQHAELGRISAIRTNAVTALQMLQRDATAAPCSADFLAQMQRVAFLPDGLNEFLYAPGGRVECSTSQPKFDPPVPLAPPDIATAKPDDPSWRMDRDLGPLGRFGTIGTIAQLGSFAVAIPPYTRYENESPWLHKELVARGADGKVWSIAGDHGLYGRLAAKLHRSLATRLTTIAASACDGQSHYCVASEADLFGWARDWITILTSTVVLAGLFAWICANNTLAWLNRHWSFEARFQRGLNPQSILVAYQPIIALGSDEVVGVEVLARWLDVDGTIVAPHRFIDIVARSGRTAEFTQLVADRAFAELSTQVPRDVPLEVNFNVFACDFDSVRLLRIFAKFLDEPRRFHPAVELVENHAIDFENAQCTIEALAAAGVKTYIDDFGTGYSSIERVARLAVHGVKLDRSFAMSPPDSVMGRMLVQVIEMIRTSGRLIVVEGVETLARLNLLRATGMVDCVQGYVVARPLGIDELVTFLSRGRAAWAAHPAAA
ncbi:MAG: EAL domain-containing protein [Hyphomicrobium sp.]|nr:EAL domain-containing protein [Hyphomicrobium sp.]